MAYALETGGVEAPSGETMKTHDFIISNDKLVSDLHATADRVIDFLKDWPEKYPPDISRPHLEEGEICYELEWYHGGHDSVVLFIRTRNEPILFLAEGGEYAHIHEPTNEQILKEVQKKPVIQGNLQRFWR